MFKRYFLTNAFLCLLLLTTMNAYAESLESLFSPGDLSHAHADLGEQCSKCHDKANKSRQDQLCMDCHDHKNILNDIQNKKGFHGRIKMQGVNACKQCHREHRGEDAAIVTLNKGSFDHNNTDFKLKHRHSVLNCQSCHEPDKQYREAPTRCIGCHEDQDIHKGKLGEKCESCHVEKGWKESGFDHDTVDDFPLRGKHQDVDCQLCHVGNRFKDTPKQCVSCHSLNDVHGGRYGKKCHTCHEEKDWEEVKFDHYRETEYRLTGQHRQVDCDSCHTGDLYKDKLKTSCFSCHKNDDEHKGRNGEKCQDCHSTEQWGKSKFSHDKETDFPLTGEHKGLECESCHRGDLTTELKTDCFSCHRHEDPHNGEMGEACDQCHNTKGWREKLFFEHDITRFPLIGLHAVTSCEQCHFSQDYRAAPIQCIKCHQDQDEHKGRFSDNCAKCHNPNSWKTWLFDHGKQTDFKLEGAHEEIECYSCHRSKMTEKSGLGSDCVDCHSGDDIHQGGFGRDCTRCHNTNDFREVDMTRGF